MDIRTDRVGLLLDQLDSSCEFARERMTGLSDKEYLWEPAPGAWSLRPADQARTHRPLGTGWALDMARPAPEPPPVTTIAWRLGHLTLLLAGRWEWTFGARHGEPEELVQLDPSAEAALAELWSQTERWRNSIATMTDEQLEVPGYGQYPYGLDPQLPFIGIVWWVNRELIHHLAEAALLRDLWRAGRPEVIVSG